MATEKRLELFGMVAVAILVVSAAGCRVTSNWGRDRLNRSSASEAFSHSSALLNGSDQERNQPNAEDILPVSFESASETQTETPPPIVPEPASESNDVDALIERALAVHPAIAAARARAASLAQRIPQATALPDPMLEAVAWPISNNSLQTAGGRMQSQYGLTQKFIRHEKRMTDGSIASREYEAALAEVTATEREVIQQIKFSCVELGLQRQTRAILEKSRTLIDQIIEVAEARLRAGGSQQDIIRAEIERARLDQRIIELDRRISTSLISLAAAVQLPSESLAECPYEFPIADLELAFESILASATINNPDLQRLQSNVERDTCKQYRAGLERQPDVTLGIQYGFMTANNSISPVADGRDMIGMVMGMNLPVRTARIQAGVNEACQQRIQSMHALEDEQLRLNRDLESLIEEVRSLDAQHDLLDARIQPATEQSYRVAIADYTASKLDFAQLVEAFNDLLEIEVERATLRAELARALIRMETLGGIVPSDAAPVSDPR